MRTPMNKLIASVTHYVEQNKNPSISPTTLTAIIELAKCLEQEEKILFKKTFIMGSTCKPEQAAKSANKFYTSNFEKHECKSKKVASIGGAPKL